MIRFSHPYCPPPSWRLNDNLLKDTACLKEVRTAITNFLADHHSDTTLASHKWEAFKCVIRGIFIKEQSLVAFPHFAVGFMNLAIRAADGCHVPYIHFPPLTISCKFPLPPKGTVYKTAKILQEFKNYYSSLYSIQGKYKDLPHEDKISKINDYLMSNNLPSIPPNIYEDIESDFTGKELKVAIRDLKNGKSPGPNGFFSRFYKTFNDLSWKSATRSLHHVLFLPNPSLPINQ